MFSVITSRLKSIALHIQLTLNIKKKTCSKRQNSLPLMTSDYTVPHYPICTERGSDPMSTSWSRSFAWMFYFSRRDSSVFQLCFNFLFKIWFLYLVFRWFNFEKVVKALITEKVYYLNLEQLQDIIQKVCFIEDKDEVGTMLDFYHDLGVIIRHRNTVILRAQWLIEVFRQLITIRSFNEMVSETYSSA